MIFEGTWSEGVWTSTDTLSDMYDAFEDGKIPVLHIPAYEYESLSITYTDELYITLMTINKITNPGEDETLTSYDFLPYEVTFGGASQEITVDDLQHLKITAA